MRRVRNAQFLEPLNRAEHNVHGIGSQNEVEEARRWSFPAIDLTAGNGAGGVFIWLRPDDQNRPRTPSPGTR